MGPSEFGKKTKKKTPIVSVNGFVDALLLFGQLASEAGKSAKVGPASLSEMIQLLKAVDMGSVWLPSCHSTQFGSL